MNLLKNLLILFIFFTSTNTIFAQEKVDTLSKPISQGVTESENMKTERQRNDFLMQEQRMYDAKKREKIRIENEKKKKTTVPVL